MDASMNCSAASEQLALHAREELVGEERDQLARHLEACDACRAELAVLEEVMTGLERFGIDPPPADLRSSVLGTVESLALAPLLTHAVEPPRPELKAAVLAAIDSDPQKTNSLAQVVPLKPKRARLAQVLAAAAFVIAGVVIGSTVASRPDVRGGTGGDIPAGHQTQVVALRGSGPSRAIVHHYRHDNFRITLSVEGYETTPPGTHYAVWVRGASGDVAIGTFRLKRQDDFHIPFALGVNPSEYSELVVTLEPNDGDPELTGEIVTQGNFDPESVHHGTYDD